MSCQCHQIGGPFIAEDPDCPRHGIAAQERDHRIETLLGEIRSETDFDTLKAKAIEMGNIALDY